ncbi:proteinase inhibitor I4 serpin [Kribbella capetownensis]|uniref:Proteinase inhibitor I4 serpin n=1 Tax=Kribbella capetownensis TaxID=1572659 RepID=A0A4R0IKK4_9ACTN|nr:serpin family protein [Kribbella capetownensis]TCC33309.1 proteinase inhibitor I4 serpin [Kribbella capetownensis]
MDALQVSRLTARWIEQLPGEGSTVLSGLGVRPLLAILAQLAVGPARDELVEAAGGPYDGLLQTPELRMALGLWTRPEIPLQPGVDRFLPPEVRGTLTDQAALDAWVVEQTDGLLERMPLQLTPDVLLVLASALALRTTWVLPFNEYPRDGQRWLSRSDDDLDSVRVYESQAGPLTVATVVGAGEFDVRLVVGEAGRGRGAVLAAALELGDDGVSGSELLAAEGSAPAVEVIESMSPLPSVLLSLPYFEVDAEHDLLEHPDVFGLTSAMDSSQGHFPGLSSVPLAIDQARQAVMARFSAIGFEAAAVTTMAMAAGSAPMAGAKALLVSLVQPFGFIAVHRPTGVPVVVGWVSYS